MTAPGQDVAAFKTLGSYLTTAQVAEMLQLSAKSVYRLSRADPTMPMLKLGGTVRFPRERLERWLRDREQGRPRTHSLSAVHQNSAIDKGISSA
jgi:excisionase family DNA binding protein